MGMWKAEAGAGETTDGRLATHLAATPLAARGWSELAHRSSFFWSTLSRMFFRSTRARLSSPLHTKRKTSSISSFKISSVNSTRLKGQGHKVRTGTQDRKRTAPLGPEATSGYPRASGTHQQSWETSYGKRVRGKALGRLPGSVQVPRVVPLVTSDHHSPSKRLLALDNDGAWARQASPVLKELLGPWGEKSPRGPGPSD